MSLPLRISYLLFVLSLMFPAFQLMPSSHLGERYWGMLAFLLGPVGLFAGHIAWLANTLLFFSWRGTRKRHFYKGLLKDVLAFLIALTFAFAERIPPALLRFHPQRAEY